MAMHKPCASVLTLSVKVAVIGLVRVGKPLSVDMLVRMGAQQLCFVVEHLRQQYRRVLVTATLTRTKAAYVLKKVVVAFSRMCLSTRRMIASIRMTIRCSITALQRHYKPEAIYTKELVHNVIITANTLFHCKLASINRQICSQ